DLFRVPDRLVQDVIGIHNRRHLFLRFIRCPLLQRRINLHLALGLDPDIGLGVLGSQGAFAHCFAQFGEVLVFIRTDQDVPFFLFLGVLGIGIGGFAALDDAVHA